MKVKEAVEYLKSKGIIRSEGAIKYISSKHDLKDPENNRSLDPKKIELLGEVLSSPLRVAEVARSCSTLYSNVNYYILKNKIETEQIFGVTLFKNKKDMEQCQKILK